MSQIILLCILLVGLLVVLRPTAPNTAAPEGCFLMACHDGEGWELSVNDAAGKRVCLLGWPEGWPESVDEEFLSKAGFEIC